MNNSQAFKAAHMLTREVIRKGDSYSATFGACYKLVIEQNKQQAIKSVAAAKTMKANIKAIIRTIPEAIYQLTTSSVCVMLFAFVAVVCGYIALNTHHAWLSVLGGFVGAGVIMMGMFIVSEAIENLRYQYTIEKAYIF